LNFNAKEVYDFPSETAEVTYADGQTRPFSKRKIYLGENEAATK